MKSFRLDTQSIKDTIERWPTMLAALVICALLVYVGWFDAIGRGILIVFGGVYFGYVLRGTVTGNLRRKYPNAKHVWLVSIGLTGATLGVIVRMLMPSLQGGFVDYVWIVLAFTTILAFVIINRDVSDILK